VPVTQNLGETISTFFVPIKYEVIPNVVNTAMFYYKPQTPPKIRFIHPSGMDEMKNPAGILKAGKLVKEKGYQFELLMLGKMDNTLIAAAADLGISNCVIFMPAVPYEEVAVQMQQSSALVLFSWFESLPCVILEALCCGLPVISTNVGGISEVIDRTNGKLVEAGNVEQLAAAMCELIDTTTTYNRINIADTATKKFNYATVGQQYLSLYEKYSTSID
jgi:glycosyltransferase involved in cell wall biosynthesis